MAKLDPEVLAHLEWLGYTQPIGLVVSAPALVRAGAILDRRDAEGQHRLRACLEERTFDSGDGPMPYLPDFRGFAESVLGWRFSPKGYAGMPESPIPPELELPLSEYGETLKPDFAVRELDPQNGAPPWQLLVKVLEPGQDFDRVAADGGRLEASPHGRLERLLRHRNVPAGVLFNGLAIRLVSAPRGESSGWLDFRVADMAQTGGRPISAALRLLLSEQRLLALPRKERLSALLEDSRRFQNEVSERLAEQVLHALHELLRGFQAAHDATRGELLRRPLAEHPDEVYRALLTVILRLVFLLYAEERDLLPEDETFLGSYSLAGLHERLREDAALYPDTMEQRYGAWAQLLVLFRLVHDGARAGAFSLPARHGVLFDPDRFPFLEGRPGGAARQTHERIEPPLVPDGTVYRVLEKLLVLDGERLSYRALDVEEIGSVYETMMGFRLETATGRSAAIKAQKRYGAPTTVDLETLLAQAPAKRAAWLREQAARTLNDTVGKAVADASTLDDLHHALAPVIDITATPDLVPKGSMVLQPSEERRKSGSHYTPRSLTRPIVETALESILTRLRGANGAPPRPEQILDLKVCDPAMGSGAFLVEACRQLGEALVESWRAYDELPEIPPDEDETIFARRLVAQRCLYGVDRNPVAVDLAKVSLWLATLARDHPLTFLDHALRHGDSLVGLTKTQIEGLHWRPTSAVLHGVREPLERATDLRRRIREAGEEVSDEELRELWEDAQEALATVRLCGDLVVAAFFEGEKAKEREAKRGQYASVIAAGEAEGYRDWIDELRHADPPLAAFHWELEFPEVFERENPGFDAVVGNPPFGGKNTVAGGNVRGYPDWLKETHAESHGNADLVAHFYRRAFNLLREGGTFGLIATNTIAQGDTRATGLRWICTHGGEIYCARKRLKWPGRAAVVVSVVHVGKGSVAVAKLLDGREVETITAFLFDRGGHDDPARLAANAGKSFQGSIVLGMGFTFDDTDAKGLATPLAEMHRLIDINPCNAKVICPYIGYAEVATSPTHSPHRHVIYFDSLDEQECRQRWPELMAIVEAKVRPERIALPPKNAWNRDVAKRWWQFGADRQELRRAISGLSRVIVAGSQASTHYALAFLPQGIVYSSNLTVFAFDRYACFATIHCSVHEVWARFFMSTMKDDLAYTPTTCFDPYPFPLGWETDPALEAAGRAYHDFRAALMVRNGEGLTKTYNRFHNPEEGDPDIVRLRELHGEMDRAALDAYGWSDIPTACVFLLDYEINEEEWGKKKKPWRYRWPDEVRDEVLARLLELNAERAREEARAGAAAAKVPQPSRADKRPGQGGPAGTLFA